MSITTKNQHNIKSDGEAHQKAGVEMTQDQWSRTHRDFKTTIEGQRYTLMMTSRGTSLVPVTIK